MDIEQQHVRKQHLPIEQLKKGALRVPMMSSGCWALGLGLVNAAALCATDHYKVCD